MKFSVKVILKKDVLDPQGKVVHQTLNNMGMTTLKELRQGKYFEIDIDENSEAMQDIDVLIILIFLGECVLKIIAEIKWKDGLKRVEAYCKNIYAKKKLVPHIQKLGKLLEVKTIQL